MTEDPLDAFDYALPAHQIAQHPSPERDGGRLLVLERRRGVCRHSQVRELPRWLRGGDLLVVNATRVLPARLRGYKATGGAAEALILGADEAHPGSYRALLRARGRRRPGEKFRFGSPEAGIDAELAALGPEGVVRLAFEPGAHPYAIGETPLPPYIRRDAPDPNDAERYQTTFARVPGSVAAPTAGLHLSSRLLGELKRAGVDRAELVLHIGPGTFRPVSPGAWARGRLHAEPFELSEKTAERIAEARRRGGRIVAVGTTTARVLETCVDRDGVVRPGRGRTELFLRPGSRFRAVDLLLTNFHLPRSSLLLLVAALAGREPILAAYAEAIREGYRFASYGDAMLIR